MAIIERDQILRGVTIKQCPRERDVSGNADYYSQYPTEIDLSELLALPTVSLVLIWKIFEHRFLRRNYPPL